MYANYAHFIERADVRVFERDQSTEAEPLDVVAIGPEGIADWQPTVQRFAAPMHDLKYVLRAYGANGSFDETRPQPLSFVYDDTVASGAPAAADAAAAEPADAPPADAAPADAVLEEPTAELQRGTGTGNAAQMTAAYGATGLALQNIPLSSGTVTVRGSGIPPEHTVWVAGRPVPVDEQGNFVAEEILPTGAHTVEVAVIDPAGNGELFLRDLELERNDWFYVGMADLTLSSHDTNGPIELLQGENAPNPLDSSADARLAFYVSGKFSEHWRLSASADTRDGPLEDLFSSFMDKSPESLFRRIDADYHYPTFGDDGTVEEAAPTLGKFYVRVDNNDNYGMWGNFKVGYMENELAQIDRGLYGANLHYQAESTTSFGDTRYAVDGFTAEPGTLASREEFRGTGGSLYYLHRQDLLTGSERVRIEIRDKASGIAMGVVNLRPGLDYDIDYLQGRVMLSEPLNSTVDDNLLVRSGSLSGDEAYLVVRYEYAPGFAELDAMSVGGQGHYWIGDRVRLGLTANSNEEGDVDNGLSAADVTVRLGTQSWVKLQSGQSEGLVASALRSDDGGFGFYGYDDALFEAADADASRADVTVGLGDFIRGNEGRISLYTQTVDAGYSAPGLATITDTETYGGSFRMPVTRRLALNAKADIRTQEQGLETQAHELDLTYQLSDHWNMNTGFRADFRRDTSLVVPLTQQEGERTDGVVQVGYDSGARWRAYTFMQETISVDGNREDNGRVGVGSVYRFSDRLRVTSEVSNGDLGEGAKVGTSYAPSDRTSLYLNYSLDNERADNELLSADDGTSGNLVAGMKTRLSDSTSVFLEERHQSTAYMSGLTHSTGATFVPADGLNLSASTDIGTLTNVQTGAETRRKAGGFRVGYGFGKVQLSSGIEYRFDESEQLDTSWNERTTWLFRSTFKYQIKPDWRLVGKLHHSNSESSLGAFYDGGYTEAVIGYAFRPTRNDRFDVLTKYTYLYNVPTTDQMTLQNTSAEFIQKSHVSAVDVNYDITPLWSIGGKYAYRRGEASLDRANPEFFDNMAHLYIVRADFKFMQNWEGLIETRLLELPDIGDRRNGALIAISRQLNRHVKVGVGYNFTDFSDDLTDLSFDNQGAFLNVTGAM
jgi:hypothetical protein